jgi:hypothetical protein
VFALPPRTVDETGHAHGALKVVESPAMTATRFGYASAPAAWLSARSASWCAEASWWWASGVLRRAARQSDRAENCAPKSSKTPAPDDRAQGRESRSTSELGKGAFELLEAKMKEQFGAFTMAAKRARIDAARDEGHGMASVLAFLYAAVAGGLAPSTPAMGIGVTLNTSERSQRFR